MKPDMILQSDLLDILFENRNKSYGAYVLRKEYSRDLRRSISMVTLLSGLMVMLFFLNGKKDQLSSVKPFVIPDTQLDEVHIKKKIVEPPKSKPVKTIANVPPTIVGDELADNKTPDIKDLAKTSISSITNDGPDAIDDNISPPQNDENSGPGKEIVHTAPIEPEILKVTELQPEFPGGVEGWRRFLSKNLKAPEDGGENSRIIVIVKFVVNEDGSLTNLEISKSGGSVFDAEVLRVMKKSPKWIAGSNQGRKVKVFHSQPVIFVYEAE